MKSTFIIVFLLATVLNLYVWQILPDRVAVHFGHGGRPNGWAGKDANFLMIQGMYVFLFLMFYYLPVLVSKTPSRWVNLPNRNFWMSPENRDITRQKIANFMYEMGIYFFLFFVFIGYLTAQANLNPPVQLDESKFLIAMMIFWILIIYWTVKLFIAFRIPKK